LVIIVSNSPGPPHACGGTGSSSRNLPLLLSPSQRSVPPVGGEREELLALEISASKSNASYYTIISVNCGTAFFFSSCWSGRYFARTANTCDFCNILLRCSLIVQRLLRCNFRFGSKSLQWIIPC